MLSAPPLVSMLEEKFYFGAEETGYSIWTMMSCIGLVKF